MVGSFGFAVSPLAVGAGAFVLDIVAEGVLEGMGAVAGPVIGQSRLTVMPQD